MASQWFYNGQLYTTPTTQSAVDDSAEAPSNATVGNTLAIIGAANAGQPNVELSFDNPNDADAILVSGPLHHAVKKAFAASSDTNAPNVVKAVRIGQATQATLTLMDLQGNPSIYLSDPSYGPVPPRVQVQTGTTLGTYKVSIAKGQSYVTQDNIGGTILSVSYSGAAASGALVLTATSASIQMPIGTVVATLPFQSTTIVQDIVDMVNTCSDWTATPLNGKGRNIVLGQVDSGTISAKGVTATATANYGALLSWFGTAAVGYVVATGASPTNGNLFGPAPINWTYLSGASYPAILTSDWTNALNVLQSVDCQWVVPLSGDPAVAAATDAHCSYMSTAGRKERRALTGPNAGTTLSQVQLLPFPLNSDRTSICWPGHYDFSYDTGLLTLFPPYMTAVLVAAGFAGQSPGEPMTNKTLKIQGLEVVIRNPSDTDVLIQAGVLAVDKEDTGYKVVRSITTWLQNNNYNRVEVSCGAAVDYVQRTVRNAVDPLRGGEAAPQAISRAIVQAETALRLLAVPAPNGPGVIVGDANSPAYQNISASIEGDAMLVDYQCSPVVPLNFIGCTAHIVPYSGSISATAST